MAVKKHIPEKQIENQILHWLASKGIFAWKNQSVGVYDPTKRVFRRSNSPFQFKGVSDILGILPDGKFLAIEVKSGYNKASEEQDRFIKQILINRGIAFVAHGIDIVEMKLREFGYV